MHVTLDETHKNTYTQVDCECNLRRDYFCGTDKLGVGDSLPMAFEDGDWQLEVSEVVVMYTVVWK